MEKNFLKFLFVGFLIAVIEEFITQGVLKNNIFGWIIPTIIAFVPFLIIVYIIGIYLKKKMKESTVVAIFYIISGCLGLMVEWFLIGLNPWNDPTVLQIPFQLSMFSFWGTVAFAPQILLDEKEFIQNLKKFYKRFLCIGFVLIYFIALTTNPVEKRFTYTIITVILFFLLLNIFYYKYVKILGNEQKRTTTP